MIDLKKQTFHIFNFNIEYRFYIEYLILNINIEY